MTLVKTDNSVGVNRNLCSGLPIALQAIGKGMETIGKRVRARRIELGLSQTDLGEKVGMKQQGIQSIEDGKSERPRKLRELAVALETTQEWLLGEAEPTHFLVSEELRPVDKSVPVIGEVAAGLWLEVGPMPEDPQEWLPIMPVMGSRTKGVYSLRVRGNSMDKIAPEGAYIICLDIGESGAAVRDGDLVVVERRRVQEQLREVTVKRVRSTKRGFELLPESNDPRWKPIAWNRDEADGDTEIRVIAHVEWVAHRPDLKK